MFDDADAAEEGVCILLFVADFSELLQFMRICLDSFMCVLISMPLCALGLLLYSR